LPLPDLVAAAKARWRVEQDYRELKEELGLDHFEGRGWSGWHHHLALVTAAFVFLREEQRRRGTQKKPAATDPAPSAPAASSHPHPPEAADVRGVTPALSAFNEPDAVLLVS
jgi:SRSO17 transposase